MKWIGRRLALAALVGSISVLLGMTNLAGTAALFSTLYAAEQSLGIGRQAVNPVVILAEAGTKVRTLDAHGDNRTDDGPVIQAAHDALPESGGMIYLPPRDKYAVATKIRITKPVMICGAGWASIVRANGPVDAVFEINAGGDGSIFKDFRLEGSKSGRGGTIQRGIYFNGAKDGLVQNVCFSGPDCRTGLNFGVDIHGVASGRTRVLYNRFERLVSSSGNGSSVLIEYSNFNSVVGNVMDGSEFNNADGSPGAAIFLSATTSGTGSTDNYIGHNRIHDHAQVGIALNSATYTEFPGNLGACDNNIIEGNDISRCRSRRGGDASSGLSLVGNSSFNRILDNTIHHNGHPTAGGYGITLAGVAGVAIKVVAATNTAPIVITTGEKHGFATGNQVGISGILGNEAANGSFVVTVQNAKTFSLDATQGSGPYQGSGLVGLVGHAKIDEIPYLNELRGNRVYANMDDGIRNDGPIRTVLCGNVMYGNGQRAANRFDNIALTQKSATVSGAGVIIRDNQLLGRQVRNQVEIGGDVEEPILQGNVLAWGLTDWITDAGRGPVLEANTRIQSHPLAELPVADSVE